MMKKIISILMKKFLRKIILSQQKESNKLSLSIGFMIKQIPESLLTPELRESEKFSLSIDGEEFRSFRLVYNNLRKDISTEYLKDKELEDELWYLLCDVHLNKKRYSNPAVLNNRVDEFVKQICQPFKVYEVLFGVSDLSLKEYPLPICDVVMIKLSVEDLENMDFKLEGKIKDRIFDEFTSNSVIIVTIQGNNSSFVIERAREKAEFALKVVRVYLNKSMSVRDENLLFDISEFAIIKDKSSGKSSWSWKRKRAPYGITIADDLLTFIEKANEHFKVINKFTTDFQSRVERAIYWIGASINEEILDHKMIYLCTALESLLSSQDDKRKGEIITSRMVILNHLIDGHFPDPFQLMWFYALRSRIVHGSAIGETTGSDYSRLYPITTEILFNLINLAIKFDIRDYASFITILENKENLKLIQSYFSKFKGEWPQSIQEALEEKLAKF